MITPPSGGGEEDGSSSDASLQTVLGFEGPKDLGQLAEAINHYHQTAQEHLRKGGAYALATGQLLEVVKKQVGRGNWLPWVTRHCVFSERTAQGYMKFARLCRAHPDKAAALLWGTFSKALRSLPVPKSAIAADLKDEDDEQVEQAMKHASSLGIVKRYKSDADKVLGVWVSVYDLGKAIERAPLVDEWLEHAEPHHLEQLARFLPAIFRAVRVVAGKLNLNLDGEV